MQRFRNDTGHASNVPNTPDSGATTTVSLDFDNEQDKIYIGVGLAANPNTPNRTTASFSQQFSQSIVNIPENYYGTCIKFSVPTSVIPTLLIELQKGSFTETRYSVTIEYNNEYSQETVIYVPQSGLGVMDETYNYLYNYDSFLQMVNTALDLAFTAVASDVVGALAPYFQYDPTSQLISFICQREFYDETLGDPIKVYLNYNLSCLLIGIAGISAPNGSFTDVDGEDFLITPFDAKNNWYQPPNLTVTVPPLYYQMSQQSVALQAMSPLKAIRLSTSQVPITQEPVTQMGQSAVSNVGVLQQFVVNYTTNEPRPVSAIYTPNQYHLSSMGGKQPLLGIDFSFVWVDTCGKVHPIFLPDNSVASVEFAFFKKKTFTS